MDENNLKLSDEVISQIAKLVQVAILSGTDVVDNFRQLRLVLDEGMLQLSDDYKQQFETNIQTMLQEIEENSLNEGK